jgi:one_C_dehyd_C: formylmethanofuran dehydrogenase subunit C
MNSGTLTIHGHCGDATGYAMRGGTIFIEGNVGYRAGIHMKAYQTHIPVLVVGGEAGSFLGEYQAGGYIIVLGLNTRDHAPVGRFPAAGMHGGKIFLRTDCDMPFDIPAQVLSHEADDAERRKSHRSCGSSRKSSARMRRRFSLTASLSLCRTARIRIAPCM